MLECYGVGELPALKQGRKMAEPEKQHMEIRVIAYREGDHYVAQGLEFDICVQAKTLEELQVRFDRAAFATLAICRERGTDPREAVPQAPREFWEMFEEARVLLAMTTHEHFAEISASAPAFVPAFRWHERLAA